MVSRSTTWDKFWTRKNLGDEQIAKVLERELLTVRWSKIEKRVLKRFSGFKDLEVMEIGCGAGTLSMIMALKGANVSLLDYSQTALNTARDQFKRMDLRANFILADALSLPADLKGSFDITMSFGLAEHFAGAERREIICAHKMLLKSGGISFISVPNALCFPYRIYKKASELAGLWEIGDERPFSRAELRRLANEAGYNEIELFGGSFLHDFNYFLFGNAKRLLLNLAKRRSIRSEMDFKVKKEIPSFLDDYLGYSLVLVGFEGSKE